MHTLFQSKKFLIVVFFILTYSIIYSQAASTDFVLTYKTDNPGQSNNTSISFDVNGSNIQYDVDWDNDGTFDQTYNTAGRVTHNYGTAGTYTIRLRGTVPHFYQYRYWEGTTGCDAEKLIAIEQWGDVNPRDYSDAFHTCTNLVINANDVPNLIMVSSMKNMFNGCSNMNHAMNSWNTNNITDMSGMFSDCSSFNQNLNSWDVSNVTKMGSMFYGCSQFDQDLNNWNTGNVTEMPSMFSNAVNFNGNISSWNVSNVTDMSYMFHNDTHFNINIGAWNTANLEITQHMFENATAFNQDINSWNMSKVFWTTYMFDGATSFNQDLPNWDMHLVQSMYRMFKGATNFNGNITNWNTGSCTNMEYMFNGASQFNQNLNWNVSHVTKMSYMFADASMFNGDISGWDTHAVTTMTGMFRNATHFDQNIGSWNLTGITSVGLSSMFNGASAFNQDIGSWSFPNANSLSSMFNNATSFNQDLSSWNTSNISSTTSMFSGATSFDQDISSWDVSNVSSAWFMFDGVTLSTANYDALLIAWDAQNLQPNVGFSGGNSLYCAGQSARSHMISSDNWSISDGGQDPNGCGSCSGGTTTWDGTSWNNGNPNSNTPVIINGNYSTSSNGNFTSCDCTINNGVTLTINANDHITVHNLTNNGTLIVNDTGSFVQLFDDATVSGSGNYTFYRKTRPYVEYDYSYWSSPTNNETIGNVFNTHSSLVAGASDPNEVNDDNFSNPNHIYWLNTANFNDDSPADTFDDEGDDWQVANAATTMTPGKGFIAMGAGADFPFNTNFANNLQQEVYFEGAFNTGTINYPVVLDNSTTDSFTNQNLIGNPYPSAIDAIAFMADNLSVLDGTMYFWTHDSPINSSNPGPDAYNFNNNDYAVATSDGTVFNYTSNGSAGTTATQYIAGGQGFLVNANQAGNVVFKNTMRVETPNNQFLRSENSNLNRFWLDLSNEAGAFRQLMIAFYPQASDIYNPGLDGAGLDNGNDIDFFSIISNDNRRFAIQSLGDFTPDKQIPLGIEIVQSGTYNISLDHSEGIFNGTEQAIYLQDNLTQEIHNLSESDYSFTTDATTDLRDRFVLRFMNEALSYPNFYNDLSVNIFPNPSQGKVYVTTPYPDTINYQITDITGKKLTRELLLENNKIDLSNLKNGIYLILFTDPNTNRQSIQKIVLE